MRDDSNDNADYIKNNKIETGVRLGNHFYSLNALNLNNCFKECSLLEYCFAITFVEKETNYLHNCYLYKNDFSRGHENGWTSVIKSEYSSKSKRSD